MEFRVERSRCTSPKTSKNFCFLTHVVYTKSLQDPRNIIAWDDGSCDNHEAQLA